MKKKTDRKVKEEKKEKGRHWSAFDEPLWGPTCLQNLLDEAYDAIQEGRCLSLADFRKEKKMSWFWWKRLEKKNPFFRDGVAVLKDFIYSKRIEAALADPGAEMILMKGLNNYDLDGIAQKREEKWFDLKMSRKMATFQHGLSKDLSTHNAQLKKNEETQPLELFVNVMRSSDGRLFTKFGGPEMKEEPCPSTQYPTSTTSDLPGTNNEL